MTSVSQRPAGRAAAPAAGLRREDDNRRWQSRGRLGLERTARREFPFEVPPTPSFDEPIGQVQARVEAAIGKTAVVQGDLAQPHPLVAKLLHQDEERRAKSFGPSYVPAWEKVL